MRWAYLSATGRALEIYSEPDGHDHALLGNIRFTYFRDRLDRVFACEHYSVRPGQDAADLDLLYAELSTSDIEGMPHVAPDLVRRSNLNGSPGWALGNWRFLLAAFDFGKLHELPWPQRSPTKQQVAGQRAPELPQPSLFEDFAPEEIGGLRAAVSAEHGLDLTTFVVAHSLDPLSGQTELVLGRPRLNSGGGEAWHWCQDLLPAAPPDGGGRRVDETPLPAGPDPVPDADVRLRQRGGEQRTGRASDRR